MKTYQIIIEPLSPFGTPLKGDTLFGHFCWQAAYDDSLLSRPLDEILAGYQAKPFAVFSSAFPYLPGGGVALKRPDLPLERLFDFSGMQRDEIIGRRKQIKRRKWLLCRESGALKDLKNCDYADDETLAALTVPAEFMSARHGRIAGISKDSLISHNSINRLTGTTGEGFAPFSGGATIYYPGVLLAVFVGIDTEVLTEESLKEGFKRIGASGFGRDASTGMGRFRVEACAPFDLMKLGTPVPDNAAALYTLAPSVPEKGAYAAMYFSPFTRFGRHGDRLVKTGKPFKNPVIMAEEGAILVPKEMPSALARPYVGTGLTGLSKALEGTVAQGYSLYIPVGLEVR